MNVYSILLEGGFVKPGLDLKDTDLFRRSLELGLIARPDEPESAENPGMTVPGAEVREKLYQVQGMWCASCAWLIERILKGERGVCSAEVFFASDMIRVKYLPQFLPPGRIEKRVAQIGYCCSEYTGAKESDSSERRDLLLRMGVAGFIWMNIMYLSMVFYVGYFEPIAESARRILPFVLTAISAPAVFYSGAPILRIAGLGARERLLRVESLLALGILSAWLYSSAQAFRGGQHFYFDTACAIVTLVLAGKLIERGARERTAGAVSLMYRMMPRKARIMEGDSERFVSVEALEAGMIFTVKAGEGMPADGVVLEGNSHVDESVLTGESAPKAKEPGCEVICGSTNGGGVLRIRATHTGADTALSKIIRMVEITMSSRSQLERLADRISRIFVPAVIILAVLTFGSCLLFEDVGDALMRGITVLVVACPCALGIATPLAVTAAVDAASRRGILISDVRFLETVCRLDTVFFDKTGTLTLGEFRLVDHALAEKDAPDVAEQFAKDHLPLLASLERYSEHPLGRAVTAYAAQAGIDLVEALGVTVEPGQGIRGRIGDRHVFIGSRGMTEMHAVKPTPVLEKRAEIWSQEGLTLVWYGWGDVVKGVLAFGDRLKPAAPEVVRELKGFGTKVRIVSGDTQAATAFTASAVCADGYIAACRPGEKEEAIADLQRRGEVVAMVGDGVNDAPALAQADLGIALSSGTDIAMRSASVTLMSSDLRRIPEVFTLARRTVRIIRQNLFWAFLYNAAGISLAMLGKLNPIAAAAAMVLSSVSVILNSQRVRAPKSAALTPVARDCA